MNRYILIRRLRGPAFLLLIGVNALLAQAQILGWSKSWPFYLILAGILALAERAAIAGSPMPQPPYPGAQYPGAPYAGTPVGQNPPVETSTSIVPSHTNDFGSGSNGGQQ